jgi:hypothetical protein
VLIAALGFGAVRRDRDRRFRKGHVVHTDVERGFVGFARGSG